MQAIRCCLLIGNSRWHWAIEKSDSWYFLDTSPNPQSYEFLNVPIVAWAAVGSLPKNILLQPSKKIHLQDIPLQNLPPWLGIDRALAGWGAFQKAKALCSNSLGILVADAGTVLSLTQITSKGEFAGGQLIAGLSLQLSAMADGTKNLTNPGPQCSNTNLFPIKTAEAMQRGSLQALIGALIEAKKDSNMPLWLCGGDSPLLYEELRKRNIDVMHYPNLALEGMINIQH